MISPPHTHARSAVSPQQSIQEEPEHELIGAGLPLLQRLKLLRAKEERLAKECHAKVFDLASLALFKGNGVRTFLGAIELGSSRICFCFYFSIANMIRNA